MSSAILALGTREFGSRRFDRGEPRAEREHGGEGREGRGDQQSDSSGDEE